MRVFLTGATGFIGSAIVRELIENGHTVLGLSRSDAGDAALLAAGAEVHRGDLEDLDSLRSGAAAADGVIHCGFVHDFTRFKEVSEIDKLAIEAMGSVLAGSDRPLIVSSGFPLESPKRPVTEDVDPPAVSHMPRVSEQCAMAMRSQGVNVSVVRLPQVHDPVKQGLITYFIALAREKGVSPYVGDGSNRMSAAHVLDVARLYRLALEKGESGAKYHAVGEDGVPLRAIAEAIGRGLKIPVVSITPEEAPAHFGFLAMFTGLDLSASSAITQERMGWHPNGPGLIADMDAMQY